MPLRFILLLTLLRPISAAAQQTGPVAAPSFNSWEPVGLDYSTIRMPPPGARFAANDRAGNAALGGVLGALAGVTFCTVVSNLANEGTGFSTCTTKGYLLTGGIGLALGLVLGLAV